MKKIKHADITSFAALLGDSFATKIDLLTQIVQRNHFPSVGRYKERLLSSIISEYIPRKFSVGTGFVLFANEAEGERAALDGFDFLNMSSHTLSRQCDIIIFDEMSYPVIFKDEDFVVVRPEAVKAIIEVKSTASTKELHHILDSFTDFGRKWRRTQIFYQSHHQNLSANPTLQAVCWDVIKNKNGRALLTGEKCSSIIAEHYRNHSDLDNLAGFPRLDRFYLYNEWESAYTNRYLGVDEEVEIGWHTSGGKFLRRNPNGEPYEKGDRTIASLLANLHYVLSNNFNRFYSYADEIRGHYRQPSKYNFSPWVSGIERVRAANSSYVDGRLRQFSTD